jgi:hypothetical protein
MDIDAALRHGGFSRFTVGKTLLCFVSVGSSSLVWLGKVWKSLRL